MKERPASGEPVLAEAGRPVMLSLDVAGYFSVSGPWLRSFSLPSDAAQSPPRRRACVETVSAQEPSGVGDGAEYPRKSVDTRGPAVLPETLPSR